MKTARFLLIPALVFLGVSAFGQKAYLANDSNTKQPGMSFLFHQIFIGQKTRIPKTLNTINIFTNPIQ